jgi:hypothetical protein
MADFNVNHITGKQGQQGTVLAGVTTVSSTGAMRIPSGPTEQRGGRGRGVWGGGYNPTMNTMEYITIATTGNAIDFGDLVHAKYGASAVGSPTRGIFMGGDPNQNKMYYFTFSSSGGTNTFGDLKDNHPYASALSNDTRGMIFGGNPVITSIEYITMATTGDASSFGDLFDGNRMSAGAASPTRGIIGGGIDASTPVAAKGTKSIQYVTIASKGNSKDFGELRVARYGLGGCSSPTRALFAGGYGQPSYNNAIDSVEIPTLGNGTDFGDLTQLTNYPSGASSHTRGCWGGGYKVPSGANTNVISYSTIASAGNATDFGDLTVTRRLVASCSNVHGGLGD